MKILRAETILRADARRASAASGGEPETKRKVCPTYLVTPDYVNADRELRFERGESLSGKDICVIGAGDIGSHLGKELEALRAKVRYATRDDDLMAAVKRCQLIVNSLNLPRIRLGRRS